MGGSEGTSYRAQGIKDLANTGRASARRLTLEIWLMVPAFVMIWAGSTLIIDGISRLHHRTDLAKRLAPFINFSPSQTSPNRGGKVNRRRRMADLLPIGVTGARTL
jgi:hypothetical protein